MQWLAHFCMHFSVPILAYEGHGLYIPLRDGNNKSIHISESLNIPESVKSQFPPKSCKTRLFTINCKSYMNQSLPLHRLNNLTFKKNVDTQKYSPYLYPQSQCK